MSRLSLHAALIASLVPTESWEPKPTALVAFMANESTTTTLNDITNASLVQPVIVQALSEKPGYHRFCEQYDLTQQPTSAAIIPTQTSWWGSPNDRGAGVDTELGATEGTALGNTAVSTGGITCSTAEYGVAHFLTDNVQEDSVRGIDVLGLFTGTMLKVLLLALDDDYLALYASLSNVVGSTGVDISIANMIAAYQGLRTRGVDADVQIYVLDNEQAGNVEAGITAASTSMAVWALAADRLLDYRATNSMLSRMIGTFRGQPMFCSGLTDTANAGADVVGGLICPTSSYNDAQGGSGATTHAMAWKRMPTLELQRQAKGRGVDIVMTARAGFAEQQDGSGAALITDAP